MCSIYVLVFVEFHNRYIFTNENGFGCQKMLWSLVEYLIALPNELLERSEIVQLSPFTKVTLSASSLVGTDSNSLYHPQW